MLSCAQSQNVIDGKKRIILNPSPELKSGFDTVTFAEGDVWGIDILVASTEDGKVRIFMKPLVLGSEILLLLVFRPRPRNRAPQSINVQQILPTSSSSRPLVRPSPTSRRKLVHSRSLSVPSRTRSVREWV